MEAIVTAMVTVTAKFLNLNCILVVGLNQLEHLAVGIAGNEIPCYARYLYIFQRYLRDLTYTC